MAFDASAAFAFSAAFALSASRCSAKSFKDTSNISFQEDIFAIQAIVRAFEQPAEKRKPQQQEFLK